MSKDNPKVKKEATDTDNGNGADKTCPPGMKMVDGDCVPANGDSKGEQDEAPTQTDNAGDTNPVGTPTLTSASNKDNPADTHDCPDGTTWNGEECVPSGDPAGQPGGGGTGNPETPGKESARNRKWFEMMMAQYAHYFKQTTEVFKNSQQKALDALTAKMGIPTYSSESAAFGVKQESISSKVNDSGFNASYESTVAKPAKWFEDAKKGLAVSANCMWTINPEAYLATLPRSWMNYGSTSAHVPISKGDKNSQAGDMKGEAIAISAGEAPQLFSKQVYLIPGGRMRVPIRQFLDTQIIEDADRFHWYKVTGFTFDGSTPEGSAATDETQTITRVTGTPALLRANQTINYAAIENAPFDLIEAFNRAAALGALAAEATDVLDTVYDAITPTNWVNGNTGGEFTDDDVASMTMKQEGLYAAKRLIESQGGDTSPGNMVFFAHPKAIEELILDTAADFFTGDRGNPLHSTALGLLENRLGVDIVVTNAVNATDNTTNDTYRNILAMKGSIGLAVAADLQIEAQRRPDLSAIKVGARHRIKGAVIDETMTARISTAQ